ncbi:MAG TPA: ATP-binding protein [Gaiellaceae bacterium]|nr:ATP-binding protein [Gaiellaceae bacterium]
MNAATAETHRTPARQRLAAFTGSHAVKRRVQFSLFILLLSLAAVLGTGIAAAQTLYNSAEVHYVKFALPLRATTRDLLFQIEREESGVRGYVITQNRKSLGPYFDGRRLVTRDLSTLDSLSSNHPELAKPLAQVRGEVVSLHGFYDRLIVFVADGGGRPQAERDVLDGATLATQLRNSAGELQQAANRLVSRTQHQQHNAYVRTLVLLSLAGALSLSVAIWLLVKLPERLRSAYASEEEARRRAEQGANAAKALAHVSEAVVLIDDDDIVRYWNEGAERLFNVAANRAMGAHVAAVVPDYERVSDATARDDRFVPVTIDGDEHWVSPALSAFEGGRVLTVADATAGHRLERMRSEFVATASHELRTPLTTVFGGVQTLRAHRDVLTRGQQERLLQMMEQESSHLVEIVDQLLISAQLDRATLRIEASDFDVPSLCRAVVESAQLRVGDRNLIMLQAPGKMSSLHADSALVRQILVNLVDNAIKYSTRGDRIEVLVSDETTQVRVAVVDEGIGIPPSEQDRIFEKFYRVDPEMATGIGGSGLGLYISREIAQQMGGSLTMRSAPGRGSTFVLQLPRDAEPAAA